MAINKNYIALSGIIIITALAYLPMLQNQFTYYSDDNYVLYNPLIQNWSWINVKYQFLSFFDGHYHPLTLLSLALSYKMAGVNAMAYQATNLLLHLLNTVLVFVLVQKLAATNNTQLPQTTNKLGLNIVALVAAMVFGLHTLHVESVARITERKDMLYAFFFLASAIQYVQFNRTQNWVNYAVALGLFLLSLLSKGQAVSLALTVVLIDWWMNKAWYSPKLLTQKIPFFALAAFFGYLNLLAQRYTGYFLDTKPLTFYEPLLHACYVLSHYWQKLLLPLGLSVHYSYPYPLGTPMPAYLWAYLLPVVAAAAMVYVFRRYRWLVFGALFYGLNVALMLRLIPVADNIMPDRYNYIPLLGYAWVLGYVADKCYNSPYKKLMLGLMGGYALLMGVLTWQRCSVWHNGVSVFADALAHNPTDSQMWQNWGDAHNRIGQPQTAETSLQKAIDLDSSNLLAYISLYNVLLAQQKTEQAQTLIQQALRVPIHDAQDYGNRAAIRHLLQDNQGALADFNHALQLNPYLCKALYNRGSIYLQLNQPNLAIADYQAALAMHPPFVDNIWLMSAKAQAQLNNLGNAKNYLDRTIAFNPYYAEAYQLRAWLYYTTQNLPAARADLLIADRLGFAIDPKLRKAVLGNDE
ncbi:MAG: hypothetical protein IPN94_11210 [Sphingobacteriales bacterium]|nr:hypothetical protein [Sphingobacteriales bacterium]